MIPIEIQVAVEAARRHHGKFVFVPAEASDEMRDALTNFATENGREVLTMPGESSVAKAARQWVARDVPVINAADERAFIANLHDIASGKKKVV